MRDPVCEVCAVRVLQGCDFGADGLAAATRHYGSCSRRPVARNGTFRCRECAELFDSRKTRKRHMEQHQWVGGCPLAGTAVVVVVAVAGGEICPTSRPPYGCIECVLCAVDSAAFLLNCRRNNAWIIIILLSVTSTVVTSVVTYWVDFCGDLSGDLLG